jgi:xylan 1,4-beta-xylosidase
MIQLRVRCSIFLLAALAAVQVSAQQMPRPATTETIVVDASAPRRPLPHFWEHTFGSGRAVLTLRESYRRDLRDVKRITGFEYVRFHAIFHDEIGLYDEDKQGSPVYNFSYIDQVYDGLLQNGVRPFVELSFMPRKLSATPPVVHPFWYKPLVSPPKDWKRWDDLITNFARHLVERYGIEEVSKWYFEVWNEPNIDFWAGEPKFETYLQLYDHTARALKAVDKRLRVGGPSTAQAAWVDVFLKHAQEANVPIDFASTHVYANDTADNVFGTAEVLPRNQMVCRAVRKVHDQIKASAKPELPLMFSEYNASYMNEPAVTDTIFMGPWLADTIRQCDGLVDSLAYWTFSDVFEEQGVVKQPFYGGFGLIAAAGIPKPSFNVFALLHRLGSQRIPVASESALATQRTDDALVVAVWNLFLPDQTGSPKTVTLKFQNHGGRRKAQIHRVDQDHGNALKAYAAMGSPHFPSREQLEQLRKAGEMAPTENTALDHDQLNFTIPAHGLVLIELK